MEHVARERYFFVHLQKTAGTTLRQRLSHLVGESAMYPSEVDGDTEGLTFLTDELARRYAARASEIRIVFGHFPLCARELLEGSFRTLTMLREPVERTLSYLRHHREWTPADQDKTLDEIYDDPFRFHGLAHNHMTKMFSLTLDEMTDGMLTKVTFGPERLERAKAALETVDVVGVQEAFAEFCEDLNAAFGWQLGDRPRFANRSTSVDVTPTLRERIAKDNAADSELYEYALRLIGDRRAAAANGVG